MARGADEDAYSWKRDVAAIYADSFEVSIIPDAQMTRMAFGEFAGRGKPTFIRVAVAMPIEDARELVRVLGNLIREADEKEAARERAADNG